ncbi:MAG TPA: helix-turn-helix domain-containing protein [Burkholderiaceae bacterium]|nr:helix-turn-helix domain-containing protein [Burkholderiaceae bacterium]
MTSSASRRRTPRLKALQAVGATHPHAHAVTDALFLDSAFFDPNDLVQVKYEMLRSVQAGTHRVVQAAQAFGLSRPAFYVAQAAFVREGLPGLLPHKRGPKGPHKLTDEVLAALAAAVEEVGCVADGQELARLLAQRCGIDAHPRTVVRSLRAYLRRPEKKLP